jgi:uncharacterized membrane protein YfcA
MQTECLLICPFPHICTAVILEALIWIFFGLLGGLMGGLLGIGGGLVFALVLPFGLTQLGISGPFLVSYTIANSLFATFFTTLSANFFQWKEVLLFRRQILVVGFFASVSTLLLLHFFVNSGWYSRRLFESVFSLILAYMMFRLFWKIRSGSIGDSVQEAGRFRWGLLSISGLFSGMVSPLTGMGGGIVLVPVLHTMLRYSLPAARSISLGVITISSFVSSLLSIFSNEIETFSKSTLGFLVIPLAFPLAIGGMVGSYLGLKIAKQTSVFWTTFLFGIFLFLSFVLLQFRLIF